MSERLLSVVIVGSAGRMGKALIRNVMESETLTLVGAVDRSGSKGFGQDAGKLASMPEVGVTVTDELRPPRGSIVVDFSLPQATSNNIRRCVSTGAPLVLGTTGIGPDTVQQLREASAQIPIVSAPNFSVGVTLLTKLAGLATRALGPSWDAELFELHHKHKRDAPSGTALRIAKSVARARDLDFDEVKVTARSSSEKPRGTDEIGVFALRGGDSIGEHTLMLLGEGERLELTHRARDRAIFARGALRAARWVAHRDPGLYDMADVLGLADIG